MSTSPLVDAQGGIAALSVSHLSKSFGGARALRDVALDVRAGEVHALVGENGSGKSTLIKVLSGYHVPDVGAELWVGGMLLAHGNPAASHAVGCRFVHQDSGLVDSLSVADNLTLGSGYPTVLGTIQSRTWRREVSRALDLLELDVDPDAPVGQLSPAAKTGVALARALGGAQGGAVLLVLDEPTAALPSPQVAQLHRMVRGVASRGLGVLYVSHHLQEVFDLADRVTVLRDGVDVATRTPAQLDHRTLVELIVGGEPAPESQAPSATGSNRPILTITDLSRGPLLKLSLRARAGEIVGIAGLTGSGRDSVLAAVFGATPRDGGTVEVDGSMLEGGNPRQAMKHGVAYLPPDRRIRGGVMALSARENVTLSSLQEFWRFPLLRRGKERLDVSDWFERLDVRPANAGERNLETFSGGNQQKVLLAKWLRRRPKVLLLEEPTQGVDIAAKNLLHHQVVIAARAGACVIVSSADNEELAGLCDRVLVLVRGQAVAELIGSRLTPAAVTQAALGGVRDDVA